MLTTRAHTYGPKLSSESHIDEVDLWYTFIHKAIINFSQLSLEYFILIEVSKGRIVSTWVRNDSNYTNVV